MSWQFTGQRVPSPDEIAAHLQTEEIRREAGLEVPVDPVLPVEPTSGASMATVKDEVMQKISGLRRDTRQLRQVMDIVLEHYNVEPIVELVKLGLDEGCAPELRAKIWMELQAYRMPKLKSVEHSGTVKQQHTVMIVRFGEDGKVSTEKAMKPTVNVKAIAEEVKR